MFKVKMIPYLFTVLQNIHIFHSFLKYLNIPTNKSSPLMFHIKLQIFTHVSNFYLKLIKYNKTIEKIMKKIEMSSRFLL